MQVKSLTQHAAAVVGQTFLFAILRQYWTGGLPA